MISVKISPILDFNNQRSWNIDLCFDSLFAHNNTLHNKRNQSAQSPAVLGAGHTFHLSSESSQQACFGTFWAVFTKSYKRAKQQPTIKSTGPGAPICFAFNQCGPNGWYYGPPAIFTSCPLFQQKCYGRCSSQKSGWTPRRWSNMNKHACVVRMNLILYGGTIHDMCKENVTLIETKSMTQKCNKIWTPTIYNLHK